MHWHVLGTGAIGCLMAHRLARGGARVTLLPRTAPDTAQPITLCLHDSDGKTSLSLPWEPIASGGTISHLLVTTKAWAVLPAVQALASRLTADTEVLVLANGIGYDAELKANFPELSLTLATTTEGAYRSARWQVVHAGAGRTELGCSEGRSAPAWFADWQCALPQCHWVLDIERSLWRKLAINCAINALTAIHDCRNGQLATDPELSAEVEALCAEIAAVASACGQRQAVEGLQQRVFEVIAATADNHSSMQQDIRAGRVSEIDYINGFLLGEARRVGVAAPRNQQLLARIHRLQAGMSR